MSSMTRPRPIVQSAVVLFAPAFTRGMHNPAFGRLPQRERRLPVGPSDADRRWAAANLNADTTQYEVAGMSEAAMDSAARDSAELDRVSRGPIL